MGWKSALFGYFTRDIGYYAYLSFCNDLEGFVSNFLINL
jgi:hypothetical protein